MLSLIIYYLKAIFINDTYEKLIVKFQKTYLKNQRTIFNFTTLLDISFSFYLATNQDLNVKLETTD